MAGFKAKTKGKVKIDNEKAVPEKIKLNEKKYPVELAKDKCN